MSQNVVYIAGGEMWVPCFVSIESLLSNNTGEEFDVYVLSEEGPPPRITDNLEYFQNSHEGSEIHIIELSEETYSKLPGNKAVSNMANVKLIIPDILSVKGNILYLDVDTIINDSIISLLSKDMTGTVLAAAPSVINRSAGAGIPLSARYFNSGIMYINQEEWDKNDITERSLEYIKKYSPRFTEQTALNGILHQDGLVNIISPKYNITRRWYEEADPQSESVSEKSMKILHYPGPSKPWDFHTKGVLKDIWLDHYNQTPFQEYYPQHKRNKIVDYTDMALQPFPRVKSVLGSVYRMFN